MGYADLVAHSLLARLKNKKKSVISVSKSSPFLLRNNFNQSPCHPSRWGFLTGALLLLSSVLLAASAVLGNVGMLALRDALMAQADFAPGDYLFYAALDAGEGTEQIAQTLRHAVALNPGSPSLRWALGDCVVVTDHHMAYDWDVIREGAKVVVDTRHVVHCGVKETAQ